MSVVPTVRLASSSDLPRLLELAEFYCQSEGKAFEPSRAKTAWVGLFANSHLGATFVIEDGTQMQGYAVITWGYGIESGGIEALIDEVFVTVQGKGLGQLLINACLDVARHQGAQVIFLETEAANHRARDFYVRNDFEIQDSIWLSRRLID